LPGVVRLTREK